MYSRYVPSISNNNDNSGANSKCSSTSRTSSISSLEDNQSGHIYNNSKIHVRKLTKSESQSHFNNLEKLREKYSSLKHSKTDSALMENSNNLRVKLTPKRKGIQVLPPLPPDYNKATLHTPPRNSSPKYELKTVTKDRFLKILSKF